MALINLLIAGVAAGATITVQSTSDGAANAANCPGAGCRLRDAIAAANDGDTVNFSVTGVITLISGELAIGKNIAIVGPGALSLAVDGNNTTRVFHITSGQTVTISNLTIQHGHFTGSFFGGGGILNEQGNLTVTNCAISNNTAQATGASTAAGGGIDNSANGTPNASLTVLDCTINGNTAIVAGGPALGGGIAQDASSGGTVTLVVTNSTISGNNANGGISRGGGIYSSGIGGSASLAINNSTFKDNTVASSNGSNPGIGATATSITTANTIYDASQSAFGTSLGYNICNGGCSFNGPGDQNNVDPQLGPLQNNGGQTSTHAPLCGSPAIDQGKNLIGISTDQRGANRTVDLPAFASFFGGDNTDVGAVESPIGTFVVTKAADTNDGTCDADCSLREAITAANVSSGIDLVALPASGVPIPVNSELLLTDCAAISGPGANQVTVSGNNSTRVFHVAPAIAVSFFGMTIANGNVGSGLGGAILNDHATVAVDSCVIASNAAGLGGGIFNDGSTNDSNGGANFILSNSTVSSNTASNGGGGIFNYALNSGSTGGTSVTLTVLNSTLNNNSTPSSGGGIQNYGVGPGANGLVAITNSTLSANSAGNGGGVYNIGDFGNATVTINNSTFSGNTASSAGGAVYNLIDSGTGGNAAVNTANTIYNAGAFGGTIFNFNGSVNSSGYNLASDNPGYLNNTGDLNNTNPQLGPLQNNGGPTATHALGTNSPAREAGNPSFDPNAFNPPMIYDQRGFGFPRVLGRLDIGAFELPAPLALSSASSLALHATFNPFLIITPFEINLPLSGNPGIECRSRDIGAAAGGTDGGHIILFYFNNQISSVDSASVSCGSVIAFGPNGNPTNQGSLQFNGSACNEQYVTATLTGIHDAYGQTLSSASVVVGLLRGDTNADGFVDSADITHVKSQSGSPVGSGNFREDLNVDRSIDSGDITVVKSQSGHALGTPPTSRALEPVTQPTKSIKRTNRTVHTNR